MSELTVSIPYEQPAIVRRDAIAGILGVGAPSDGPPNDVDSDVRVKENIRPVRW
jgi:hypothetical protein